MTGNNLKLKILFRACGSINTKIKESGVDIVINDDNCIINKVDYLKPIKIKTLGFQDLQQIYNNPYQLLTQCNGVSTIEETLYENRFKNLEQLKIMGANTR